MKIKNINLCALSLAVVLPTLLPVAANASTQVEVDVCKKAAIRGVIKKHAEKYNDEYAPRPNVSDQGVAELDPEKKVFDLIRSFSIQVNDEAGSATWLAVTEAEPRTTKKGKKYCKVLYTEVGQEE